MQGGQSFNSTNISVPRSQFSPSRLIQDSLCSYSLCFYIPLSQNLLTTLNVTMLVLSISPTYLIFSIYQETDKPIALLTRDYTSPIIFSRTDTVTSVNYQPQSHCQTRCINKLSSLNYFPLLSFVYTWQQSQGH